MTAPRTRQIAYTRPWLYPKQLAALFHPQRYGVIEATTKSGKTTGALAWLVEEAVQGRPGDQFWWVAPVFTQARMAFARAKRALPRGLFTAHESRLQITLRNGAALCFRSADHPDTLYGEDVRAAVIDEAARCKEAAWHAVRSTLTATGGPIRIIGNVKGRRNWAYRLARQAEAGAPHMAFHRLTADDAVEAGIFDVDELANAQQLLPTHVFRELYYAEASDDAGNPFGLTELRACVAPLSDQTPVIWGWDLAKSVDWTVGIALDAEGHVCRLERFQRPWEETFDAVRRLTGEVPALIDSTGVGDPIVERLQRVAGPHIHGFQFSATSKQQLMERLAVAIHERRIHFPEGLLVAELEAFEYEVTRTGVRYNAPDGVHDDAVCALALATYAHVRRHDQWPLELITGTEPPAPQARTATSFARRPMRGAGFPAIRKR